MESYKNLNGNSGVFAYEIFSDSIAVIFKGGKRYLWSNASAGSTNVEQMKRLAVAGAGLNSFIMRNVRLQYVR